MRSAKLYQSSYNKWVTALGTCYLHEAHFMKNVCYHVTLGGGGGEQAFELKRTFSEISYFPSSTTTFLPVTSPCYWQMLKNKLVAIMQQLQNDHSSMFDNFHKRTIETGIHNPLIIGTYQVQMLMQMEIH